MGIEDEFQQGFTGEGWQAQPEGCPEGNINPDLDVCMECQRKTECLMEAQAKIAGTGAKQIREMEKAQKAAEERRKKAAEDAAKTRRTPMDVLADGAPQAAKPGPPRFLNPGVMDEWARFVAQFRQVMERRVGQMSPDALSIFVSEYLRWWTAG